METQKDEDLKAWNKPGSLVKREEAKIKLNANRALEEFGALK